jgi:hypothetical protein
MMTADAWIEIAATFMEIFSFFFVTTDLIGRLRVKKGATEVRDRTRDRFDNFLSILSGEQKLTWSDLRAIAIVILLAIGSAAFVVYAVRLETASFAAEQIGRGHHPKWREFLTGIPEGAPWYDLKALLILALIALWVLMSGGVILVIVGMALFFISAFIYFAVAKAIFWHKRPERGVLFFGASLFVASKLLSLFAKVWLATPH